MTEDVQLCFLFVSLTSQTIVGDARLAVQEELEFSHVDGTDGLDVQLEGTTRALAFLQVNLWLNEKG
jgi:hypothetical protein